MSGLLVANLSRFFAGFSEAGVDRSARRGELVAAIDIGAAKIACFIARLEAATDQSGYAALRPLGFGHHASRGVKAGAIIDMAEAEEAVRAAVDAAERMAGRRIRRVTVGISGAALQNRSAEMEVDLGGYAATPDDLAQALAHGIETCEEEGSEILHVFPSRYRIDGRAGVRNPLDLAGDRLAFRLHAVAAEIAALRNLETCIERCHLQLDEVVATPFASANAALIEDERDLGAVAIDMGASATGYAVFEDGALALCGSVPLGGQAVTADIACGLATTTAHAERLKTFYGDALPGFGDERDLVDVAEIGEKAPSRRVAKAELTRIIRARLDEIFELIRDRLDKA